MAWYPHSHEPGYLIILPIFLTGTLCTQSILDALDVPESFPEGNPQRAIYCSRTLNLRSIKAIGMHLRLGRMGQGLGVAVQEGVQEGGRAAGQGEVGGRGKMGRRRG